MLDDLAHAPESSLAAVDAPRLPPPCACHGGRAPPPRRRGPRRCSSPARRPRAAPRAADARRRPQPALAREFARRRRRSAAPTPATSASAAPSSSPSARTGRGSPPRSRSSSSPRPRCCASARPASSTTRAVTDAEIDAGRHAGRRPLARRRRRPGARRGRPAPARRARSRAAGVAPRRAAASSATTARSTAAAAARAPATRPTATSAAGSARCVMRRGFQAEPDDATSRGASPQHLRQRGRRRVGGAAATGKAPDGAAELGTVALGADRRPHPPRSTSRPTTSSPTCCSRRSARSTATAGTTDRRRRGRPRHARRLRRAAADRRRLGPLAREPHVAAAGRPAARAHGGPGHRGDVALVARGRRAGPARSGAGCAAPARGPLPGQDRHDPRRLEPRRRLHDRRRPDASRFAWLMNGVNVYGAHRIQDRMTAVARPLRRARGQISLSSSSSRPASSRTGTPRRSAFSSFEPGRLARDDVVGLLRHRASSRARRRRGCARSPARA